jgi:hypothetical protein
MYGHHKCFKCAKLQTIKTIKINGVLAKKNKDRWSKLTGSSHPRWNPNKSTFKEYHRQVTRATNKHDLLILENSDKRGMAGESGAHHLDHMVSIKSGFERGIPAEVVGAKENLRFISWEENYSKRAESSMTVGELFARIEMNKYTNRPNWL